jgi:hypothetical protein
MTLQDIHLPEKFASDVDRTVKFKKKRAVLKSKF